MDLEKCFSYSFFLNLEAIMLFQSLQIRKKTKMSAGVRYDNALFILSYPLYYYHEHNYDY